MMKIGKDYNFAAMDYGQEIGYFIADNILKTSGMTLARFAHFDMQDAA